MYTLFAVFMRIHQDSSRLVIDYHEMEKSYQNCDLILEFLSLVNWIASIKVVAIVIYDDF